MVRRDGVPLAEIASKLYVGMTALFGRAGLWLPLRLCRIGGSDSGCGHSFPVFVTRKPFVAGLANREPWPSAGFVETIRKVSLPLVCAGSLPAGRADAPCRAVISASSAVAPHARRPGPSSTRP